MTPADLAHACRAVGSALAAFAGLFTAASVQVVGATVPEAAVVGLTVGSGALLIVWRGIKILSSAAQRGDEINRASIARLENELADARSEIERLKGRS